MFAGWRRWSTSIEEGGRRHALPVWCHSTVIFPAAVPCSCRLSRGGAQTPLASHSGVLHIRWRHRDHRAWWCSYRRGNSGKDRAGCRAPAARSRPRVLSRVGRVLARTRFRAAVQIVRESAQFRPRPDVRPAGRARKSITRRSGDSIGDKGARRCAVRACLRTLSCRAAAARRSTLSATDNGCSTTSRRR